MRKKTHLVKFLLVCLAVWLCACGLLTLKPVADDENAPSAEPTQLPATATPEIAAPTLEATETSIVMEDTPIAPLTLNPDTDLITRLCPQVTHPLAVFRLLEEPYSNPKVEDSPLYMLFQAASVTGEEIPTYCTLFINPFPQGEMVFAGGSLFWQTYDDENEQASIWQYDPADKLTDEVDPTHVLLPFTVIDVPFAFNGLTSYVVSEDGSALAWSMTEPKEDGEGGYAYLQQIYLGAVDGSYSDLIWSDVKQGGDEPPMIIRLHSLSTTSHTLYFGVETVGLGTQWPYPVGSYTTLYSMPDTGDIPLEHKTCMSDHWCISDYSEELDLMTYFEENILYIAALSNNETIAEVSLPPRYTTLRQAVIGEQGDVVFMAVDWDPMGDAMAPNQVALFHLAPPYDAKPRLVVESPDLRNIIGWVDPQQLMLETVMNFENVDGEQSFFSLVNLADGSLQMMNILQPGFENFLP